MNPLSKEERESELRALIETQQGKSQLVETYKQTVGIPADGHPPLGMLMGHMIQIILEKEYGAA